MLVKLLLANDIGQSTALSVAFFLGNHILSLTCGRLLFSPTPNTPVSKYSCSLLESQITFILMMFWLYHVGFDMCCLKSICILKRSALTMGQVPLQWMTKMYKGSFLYLI